MKTIIGMLLGIAGALLVLGAAGGYECDLCSLGEMLKMTAGGFGMLIISGLCLKD